MSADQELLAEIEAQLNDDILYFAWLFQIVRLQNPGYTEAQCIESVLDAVIHLHQNEIIVVGNAREIDEMVLIQPWPELNDELRARMESAIADSNDRDRDFCFWIQLTKHFAT
ncbi:MAG: hypothetical protein OES79_11675 [Planctomycetota bacterium]|nr:hypothetical protein [Planctomycetota bacterium]